MGSPTPRGSENPRVVLDAMRLDKSAKWCFICLLDSGCFCHYLKFFFLIAEVRSLFSFSESESKDASHMKITWISKLQLHGNNQKLRLRNEERSYWSSHRLFLPSCMNIVLYPACIKGTELVCFSIFQQQKAVKWHFPKLELQLLAMKGPKPFCHCFQGHLFSHPTSPWSATCH